MGLLQEIPSAERFTTILSPVIGDEATGTGVAGVLKLLENIDTQNLSGSLSAELDQSVSANISVDTTALMGGALAEFQQVMSSFPEDPASLIEPLTSKLDVLKSLSSADLSSQLSVGIDGLQNIQTLIPTNTKDLVASAADRLSQLKGEFISGEFGELKQWSESVSTLHAEIEPLLASGSGTVEERLIGFLSEKVAELVSILLPEQRSLSAAISAQFEGAISTDRLTIINNIKTELIDSMNFARIQFENGNFTNTTHLSHVQASFQLLVDALAEISAKLQPILDQDLITADSLGLALKKQFDDFGQIEIIDLGNIKDKFSAAIGRIQEAVEGLDLDVVSETIEEVFKNINSVIGEFDLNQLTTKLSDLQGQLQSVLDALDGVLFEVVASIRSIFTQIRNALHSVASSLGSYDDNGDFHFHIQQEIEIFLNGIKTTLQETIQPLFDQFKGNVGQTLQQIQDALNAVKGEIESVKAQLESTLQGVSQQLETLDVTGTMEGIRQKLDNMLGELGVVDFDPVVDPIVAQINEVGDALKKIDVSSLNEFTVGALEVSVDVVVRIDFSTQITGALMVEIDKLLEIPQNALAEIEGSVEGVLQRFGELEPGMLLSPLDDLFDRV